MKRLNWQVVLSLVLVGFSVVLYLLHYLIFKDAHHIFIYLLGDIAFIPIEVLLVTLVIHQLLDAREKISKLNKMNMVVGAFYSEVGTELLKRFSLSGKDIQELSKILIVSKGWSNKDFNKVKFQARLFNYEIDIKKVDLAELRQYLLIKREFLLRLLENPNILEHETFSELLWAVFHCTEELANRKEGLGALPVTDLEHLSGDIKRVFRLLVLEWIAYMQHLNKDYPYLFSLAMRTNPFDPQAKIIV